MKTFVTIAVVAVVAIVLVEINQSSAQGGNRRCPPNRRPPLNTTEVECDRRASLGQRIACVFQCQRCYSRENLQRLAGCRVDRQCTCLAKPGNEGSTTEGSSSDSTEPAEGSSTAGPELPSTDSELTTLPPIVETTPPQEELPTEGGSPPDAGSEPLSG